MKGTDNLVLIRDINATIDGELRDSGKAREYLNGLLDSGSLPLRFTACEAKGLAVLLVESGRSLNEMNRILYGRAGEVPIAGNLKGWGLTAAEPPE